MQQIQSRQNGLKIYTQCENWKETSSDIQCNENNKIVDDENICGV